VEKIGLKPILMAVASMALFASMDAINKSLTQIYPIPQIMAIRFALFVAIGCWLAGAGPWIVLKTKAPWWQAARTAILLLEMLCFVTAFRTLPLADVHAVAAAAPLLVTALSFFFLREKVDALGWMLVAAGMAGATMIVGPSFEQLGAAMWIAVAATLLWALYQVVTRIVSAKDSTDITTLHTPLVGLIVLGTIASFDWHPPDASGWFWLIVGGISGAGAHILIVRAIALAPASALQPYNYTLLLFATLFGMIFFGDVPGLWTWLGAAVVVACGIVSMRRAARS
jgi:drug/metabolite transporter (DMT)-like permease